MALTISKARQNLFALADAAARGELVEFTHKGKTFRLTPQPTMSKMDRLMSSKLVLEKSGDDDDVMAALEEVSREALRAWEENQEKLEW